MLDAIIYLCGHGETKDQTVQCLCHALRKSDFSLAEPEYVSGDALISRSRSIATTRFVRDNRAPYMVFLDTDIIFTVEELDRLILALAQGYPIVGGAYSVSNEDHLAIRGYDPSLMIDGGIKVIEYVSTGFMGISRNALLQIKDKLSLPLLHKDTWCECYPFFEAGRYEQESIYISEDWDFCNKARSAGLTVYVHTGCLVDHMKSKIINAEEVAKKHAKDNEKTAQESGNTQK